MMISSKVQTSKKRNSSLVIKKDNKKAANLTLIESVRGYFTNLSYGLQGLKLSYFRGDKEKQETNAFILGSEVHIQVSLQVHQELVWLTYRKNISINPGIHSDVGWGCLIRVAQMAWAQSLQRYLIHLQKRVDKHYIITPFLDEKGSEFKYSLFRFIEMGSKLWRLQPGQWYSMTHAATTLEALHKQNPLKGSQRLIIKVYNQTINIKELLQILGVKECTCFDRKANCFNCQQIKPYQKPYFQKGNKKQNQNSMNKHIVLMITTKLGEHSIDKTNFKSLLQLISLPIFNGCLGGIPGKARFLTGHHKEKISYMDPHYVEDAVDQLNLSKRMTVFQCKEVRYMLRQELDPEMTLSFYISNSTDLQQLLEAIDRTQIHEGFIKYDWETSDQFEVLGDQNGKQIKLKQKFQDLEESFSDLNRSSSMDSSFIYD